MFFRNYWIKYIILFIAFFAAFFSTKNAGADVLEDLRQQLSEKRKAVEDIENRIKEFQNDVEKKKAEATTLDGQIKVIDSNVKFLQLEIDRTNAEVEELSAEISELQEKMELVTKEIDKQKEILREYLLILQSYDTFTGVQSFFKYATLSEAITEIRSVYRAEQNSQITLSRIKELQNTLKDREKTFIDLKRELEDLRSRQSGQKKTLEQQSESKGRLLELTRAQEAEFKKLLDSSVREEKKASADIAKLDAAIREELERQGYRKLGKVGTFVWPLEPIFGISCGFNCADYPFRSLIGPHTGTDLPTNTGTPIRAAADGYAAKVKIADGAGLSYILLIHGDNISTVYMHISSSAVNEGSYVTKGQVIGYSGGAPGTRGAGLSTGPHLHFEVRKNGIPVDAMAYLP